MKIGFLCCFCRKGIELTEEVCELDLVKGEDQQTWFCHLACFEGTTGQKFESDGKASRDRIPLNEYLDEVKKDPEVKEMMDEQPRRKLNG